ncbi:hypothetical protein EW026_g6779 [Hermanssonia centrifuga]|uniref:Uncharacterized protein n=1 Tax=Hermanssonia centrifuga TaxID=98765 RepID=A0A4V6S0V1_9APHY|nr:hypothetical protein EW026_g6779 [Hermanssonia centrifuga]
MAFFIMFLGPRLTDLSISTHACNSHRNNAPDESVMQDLENNIKLYPQLQNLGLYMFGSALCAEKLLSILARLNDLRAFNCYMENTPLPRAMLPILASFPRLESLDLAIESPEADRAPGVPLLQPEDAVSAGSPVNFETLKRLNLRAFTVPPCVDALKAIEAPNINRVAICATIASDLQSMSQAISDRCQRSGARLYEIIWHDAYIESDGLDIGEDPHDIVTIHTLRPLFKFEYLVTLEITLPCTFDLTDEDLGEVAHAWPCLRKLSLGPARWNRRSKITLDGLAVLIDLCPDLTVLDIAIDATNPTNCAEPYRIEHPNPEIYSIGVADSVVSDPVEVAARLGYMLPNLTVIDVAEMGGAEMGEVDNTLSALWSDVESHLPVNAATDPEDSDSQTMDVCECRQYNAIL